MVESVQKFSLDALLSESDSTRIVEDVRKDLEKAMVRRGAHDEGHMMKGTW